MQRGPTFVVRSPARTLGCSFSALNVTCPEIKDIAFCAMGFQLRQPGQSQ